jgi:hypothetical protein
MSDRSKRLAQQFKKQQRAEQDAQRERLETDRIKNEKAILDVKTLAREAPTIWDMFCKMFVEQCEDFNKEPGVGKVLLVSRPNDSQIVVSRAGENQPSMRVSFGKDYRIRFGGLGSPADFPELRIKVLNGDSEPSVVTKDDRAVDLESTVESCICALLGIAD